MRRLALFATLCCAVASAAGGQVRVERRADGSLLMVNNPQPVPRAAISIARSRAEIDQMIEVRARAQSLDPALVKAVVSVESGYDPAALSSKGAMGLMQLMPDTASSLRVEDPWDPDENLRGGTEYLRRLLDRFDGDLELALAGYNAGPEAVERHRGLPPFPETHGYVDRVLRLFRGEGLPAADGGVWRGRPTFLLRDASGRLLLTTARPTGS